MLVLLATSGCPEPVHDGSPPTPTEAPAEPVLRVPPRRDPAGSALEYTVAIERPESHMLEVRALLPTAGAEELELFMATWTPGSYLVREFARHVEGFSATSLEGTALEWSKRTKNRWIVESAGSDPIVVQYRVYANELTVRTNFVDDELASLNGAATFITPVGHTGGFDVALELPEGWQVVTALSPVGDSGTRFSSVDFDELIDCPIVAGTPRLYPFEASGVPHLLANFGEGPLWNGERSAEDVAQIAEIQQRFWGVIPYERYTFLNLITGGRGGLEHKTSTLMLADPLATRDREDYLDWLGLVSHEFFHTWNIKRLRPAVLGPFDYEAERYTTSLWIAEGLTSYYDDLLLSRANLMNRAEYLERLSAQIRAVQTTPGRHVQALSEASFDAWIKYYRPDENSVNTAISYYRKGAVVGFLLDAEIRRRNRGQRSLDDVMRRSFELYAGDQGYTEEQWRQTASEVAGFDLTPFFEMAVDGTGELEYADALDYYGLAFGAVADEPEDGSGEGDAEPYLGVELEGATIAAVLRGTPGDAAGLSPGDEIVAVDGFRVQSGDVASLLRVHGAGASVVLLIARRGRIRELRATLGTAPDPETWSLHVVEPLTAVQQAALTSWLSGTPE